MEIWLQSECVLLDLGENNCKSFDNCTRRLFRDRENRCAFSKCSTELILRQERDPKPEKINKFDVKTIPV